MQRTLILASLSLLISAVSLHSSQAVVLNSQPFSLGYGFLDGASGRGWYDTESVAVNTPTTQGNFSFTPAPTGGNFSGDGCVFPNRVLTDSRVVDGYSGFVSELFEVPITATYTGGAPSGAAATPNYRLRLEITKISIYGGEHSSSVESIPLEWIETTPGHEVTGPNMALPISNDMNEAVSYAKVEWDPVDFEFPLANLNDVVVRKFDIPSYENDGDLRFIDGLEIEGRVSLIYDGDAPLLLGDYNGNGTVDAADYTVWRNNPSSLENEGASPGVVDIEDYNFWKVNFGATNLGSGSLAPVPEPAAGLLVLGGMLGLIFSRCSRIREVLSRA